MMTSSNFRVTGPLWGEFTAHQWIPLTKASDAELWCYFDLRMNQRLSQPSRRRWFQTPSRSVWRHRNVSGYEWLRLALMDRMTSFQLTAEISGNLSAPRVTNPQKRLAFQRIYKKCIGAANVPNTNVSSLWTAVNVRLDRYISQWWVRLVKPTASDMAAAERPDRDSTICAVNRTFTKLIISIHRLSMLKTTCTNRID